jgi:hypothetical protein
MGPGLRIVGIGAVDAPLLGGLGARLAKHGFEPTVGAAGPAVEALVGPGMRRLQALSALPALRKEPGDHVLGITEFEVTDGVKEWVYGMGEVNGRSAVFSVKPFRGGGLDGQRTLDRLAAAILHELAHNVGMVHCRNKGCLMHATHEPSAMRQLDLAFCASCDRTWHRRIRAAKPPHQKRTS